MSNQTVLSKRFLQEQVAVCQFLTPFEVASVLQHFSAEVKEKTREGEWAGIFKHMVLHAFQLDFPPQKVAAVCRGLSQLSGVDARDIENMAKDIQFGRFGANEVDRILSDHYKIDETIFPPDPAVLVGDVTFVLDLQTGQTTGPTPTKPNTDGLEAFLVGMS